MWNITENKKIMKYNYNILIYGSYLQPFVLYYENRYDYYLV